MEVNRLSLGEVPLGLLEMASLATRDAKTADGNSMLPRLVAAGEPGKGLSRGAVAESGVSGGAKRSLPKSR